MEAKLSNQEEEYKVMLFNQEVVNNQLYNQVLYQEKQFKEMFFYQEEKFNALYEAQRNTINTMMVEYNEMCNSLVK